jgi:tetratricopeptide (TPR) repeat protein/WD40 repeat protein
MTAAVNLTFATVFAAVLATLVEAPTAIAEPQEQADFCVNANNKFSLEQQVNGCTEAIESGRWIGRSVAWAYANRGAAFALKGDLERALLDVNEAIKFDPSFARAFETRSFIRGSKHDLDGAIADASEAIRLDPHLVMALNNRAQSYLQKGDTARAFADWDEALRLNPKFVIALNNRGNAYKSAGEFDRAIEDLTKAIEVNPGFAVGWHNRAIVYRAKHDFEHATADFTEALRLDPLLVNTLNERGITYQQIGDLDRSISDFSEAIRLNPNFVHAFNNRGNVYRRKGDLDRAIADFSQAIKIDPGFASAFNNRGFAFQHGAAHDQAISDFSRAIELAPNLTVALVNRANSLLRKDHFDAAINDCDRALSLNPKAAMALYVRGVAKRRGGNRTDGDADIVAARKLYPDVAHAATQLGLFDHFFLRVETGSHLQRVENLFFNEQTGQLISTSTDGTVRFWSTNDGTLMRTVMLPLLGANPTYVEKAGLSPSGHLLALGVSAQGSPEHWIFVYDAATGTGLKKLQSGGQVSAIAFSKDDRYVAVAAWDNLTVYALPKFEPVFTDRFGDVVWGLDFDKSGRLVAGSFAGEVRVYDNQFRAIARGQTSTAKEIVGVAFSPDGSRIAIGFNYGVGIEMFSADDLAALATLRPPLASKVLQTPRVAWAADGRTVFALGSTKVTANFSTNYILKWDVSENVGGNSSRGSALQISEGPASTAINMLLVPQGSETDFAVGLSDGDIYLYDAGGARRWRTPSNKMYFDAGKSDDLLVSSNGHVVAFAVNDDDAGFVFDADNQKVFRGRAERSQLQRPLHSSNKMSVTYADDQTKMRVNGNALELTRWETIAAWAIAPNEESVVLASRFLVRKFGVNGKELWAFDPNCETWAVNVTPDNNFVIIASGDGALRWLDMQSGKLVLSVFLRGNLQQWVAWTPDGSYYAPSQSGGMLIGYQIDPGNGLPKAISAETLFQSAYRSDLPGGALAKTKIGDER